MKYLLFSSFFIGIFLFGATVVSAQQAVGVDVIFEARRSVTPPFYKGKAIGPAQIGGMAHAVAYNEDGTIIDPDSLVFVWKYNGSVVTSAKGVGKNTYVVPGGLSTRPNISVEVRSVTNSLLATNPVSAPQEETKVLLYEKDPLQGILFNTSLIGTVPLNSTEIEVIAIPFGFDRNHSLEYEWRLNGSIVQGPSSSAEDTLVLRDESSTGGDFNVSVSTKSQQTILNRAINSFTLSLEK